MQLAITPDQRWSFATSDLVSAARAAGFVAAGIAADRVDSSAVQAFSAADIRCHEVLALVVGDDETTTATEAERLAGAAAAMNAAWLLTVFTAPPSSEATRILQRCGAGIAVEFSPLGPVSSIRDGLEVVHAVNRGGGRACLMIDSWHFCFSDSSWADLAAVRPDEIAYVQFTDALAPESDRLVRETLHRRALPGEGVLELDRFAATLLERGWDGIVSVEVLSAELRTLPVDVLVARLHDTTAPYWCR